MENLALSDHFLVTFFINVSPLKKCYKKITYRRINEIHHSIFSKDLESSSLVSKCCGAADLTFEQKMTNYDNTLRKVIDDS